MKKFYKRSIVIVTAAVLAVGIGVTATMAMLHKSTQQMTNKFSGTGVNIGVVENDGSTYENSSNTNSKYEEITGTGKTIAKSVKIKNITSDSYPTTDTYVRVRLVPSWKDSSGNDVAFSDYTVTYAFGTGWGSQTKNGETYYYYKTALAPDTTTYNLINSVTVAITSGKTIPSGAHFELQVLTEGIAADQTGSDGKTAMEHAWGMTPSTLSSLSSLT